jgi:hypothetical protein
MNKSQTLNRNRMLYQVAQPLSIKTQPHSLIRQPFERQIYLENDTMIVQLPTGKFFVDPDKSYLSVKLRVYNNTNTTCEATFGGGSMANLIRNIRIFHKSGTQITSGQDAHIWYKARDYAEKDTFWFETSGAVQGYNTPVLSATDVQFKMKLSDLHGFFKGHGDKLLPPEIIRDLRIEIDLNPTSQVFQRLGDYVVDGYSIDKPEIQLGLVNVMDNASANINNMATKGGLFWTYDDFFVASKNFSNTENDVVLSLDKAVSNACKAVTVIRNQNDINNITSDGYNFLYLLGTSQNPTRWTYTVGTDMYPYKKKIDEQFDAYTTCIDCFKAKNGVNLSRVQYFDGNALHVTCLETDDYLENSGIFLNTNQKLEFQLNKSSTGNNIQITTCLQHVNCLRVNSTNSRVDN